jgi:CheY-like chemotaxis protein
LKRRDGGNSNTPQRPVLAEIRRGGAGYRQRFPGWRSRHDGSKVPTRLNSPASGIVHAQSFLGGRGMKPVVLLVEDEPSIREIVADTLQEAGYICIPAGNGSDAVRIIEANLYKFDLLLSDVRMPGDVNGFQVAEQFQARFPGMPVIVMSGHIDPETAAAMTRDGFQVLVKPVRLPQILEVVARALRDRTSIIIQQGDASGSVVALGQRGTPPKR